MLLVANIGNSTVACGIYEEARLVSSLAAVTQTQATADEYAVTLGGLLRQRGLILGQITGFSLASVVPALTPAFLEFSERYLGLAPLVVGAPGVRVGMEIRTEAPQQVGSDRIVSALAARRLFGAPVIVIDFGTATTLGVVSREGDFLGGAIAPGLRIAADALYEKTAKLPRIDLNLPPRAIGRNTVAAMQSGVLIGYVGMVGELVRRISDELGGKPMVVATGGFAPFIAPHIPAIDVLHRHLVLEGLRMVYELNCEKGV